MIAPMACSRMPKCRTRPCRGRPPIPRSVAARPAVNDAASSIGGVVGPARSAEPPHSSGMIGGDRVDDLARSALRVAIPFGSAWKVGSALGQTLGQAAGPGAARSRAAASGWAVGPGLELARPRRPVRRTSPRAGSRVWASTSSRDLEGLVRVEAQHLLGGGDLVGAERRAVGRPGVLGVRGRPRDDRVAARSVLGRSVTASAADDRVVEGGDVLAGSRAAAVRPSRRSGRASRRPRSACATSSVNAMLVSPSIEIRLRS